jgi:outer membrane protein OmpA-like peptidoglycan-associated protein
MNSKSVILLGLLASLLLIFLCVFFNAERYYKELGLGIDNKKALSSEFSLSENKEAVVEVSESDDTIVAIKEEDKVDLITVEKKEETSSFNYYVEDNKTFISGKIPLLDNGDVFKELITDCSKDKLCENNVTFLDNDETLSWKGFVSSALTIFMKENIVNPKLSIDKKDISIEGEFQEQSGKEQLITLVKKHKDSYNISDMTTIKKAKIEVKDEPKKLDENSTKKELPLHEPKIENSTKNLKEEQEKISLLLKNNKINFKRNSGKIRKEGKKVLDEISKLLKGKKNILIEVQGYTDAGGKEKINLWISQARANGVKKYLIKKGIKADIITAKGFGEKKFLLPKTPYDPSNRRVEIHLKRK